MTETDQHKISIKLHRDDALFLRKIAGRYGMTVQEYTRRLVVEKVNRYRDERKACADEIGWKTARVD